VRALVVVATLAQRVNLNTLPDPCGHTMIFRVHEAVNCRF